MMEGPIQATALARELGARLAAVVPDELEVSVNDAEVRLVERGTRYGMYADLRPWPDEPDWPFAPPDAGQSSEVYSEIGTMDRATWLAAEARADAARSPVIEVDELEETLWPVLNQLQDEIAETLTEPWPAVAPAEMPMPFVELRDGRLVAGYGNPADPALTLLSVALDDLR
jgi:hypothetical protein